MICISICLHLWDERLKNNLKKQLHARCFTELLDCFLDGCSVLHPEKWYPTSFPVFGIVNIFNFSHSESSYFVFNQLQFKNSTQVQTLELLQAMGNHGSSLKMSRSRAKSRLKNKTKLLSVEWTDKNKTKLSKTEINSEVVSQYWGCIIRNDWSLE